MTTTAKTLDTIVGLVRAELPKHFTSDFIISDVQVEHRPGTQEEGYFFVVVIFEDGHPSWAWKKGGLSKTRCTVSLMRPGSSRIRSFPSPTGASFSHDRARKLVGNPH